MKAAYERGRAEAKANVRIEKLLRKWTKDVGKVRSPDRQSWTAPFAIFQTPAEGAELQGFNDQREYRDSWDQIKKTYAAFRANNVARKIYFFVRLLAWPGIENWYGSINRAANAADVRDVKFVLLVDGETPIHPLIRPTPTADVVMNGTVAIPEYHTIYGDSSTNSTATATGSDGSSATAVGVSRTSSTVSYTTTSVQGYEVYMADYVLEFPMCDPQGKPYVTPKSKNLSLKIIRWNGEHSGEFRLSDYQLSK